MGRPSRIEVTVEKLGGKPGAVLIGGTCVDMMHGQLIF